MVPVVATSDPAPSYPALRVGPLATAQSVPEHAHGSLIALADVMAAPGCPTRAHGLANVGEPVCPGTGRLIPRGELARLASPLGGFAPGWLSRPRAGR